MDALKEPKKGKMNTAREGTTSRICPPTPNCSGHRILRVGLLASGCCGSRGRAAVAADWPPRRRYCTVVQKCLACSVSRSRLSVGPIVSWVVIVFEAAMSVELECQLAQLN